MITCEYRFEFKLSGKMHESDASLNVFCYNAFCISVCSEANTERRTSRQYGHLEAGCDGRAYVPSQSHYMTRLVGIHVYFDPPANNISIGSAVCAGLINTEHRACDL